MSAVPSFGMAACLPADVDPPLAEGEYRDTRGVRAVDPNSGTERRPSDVLEEDLGVFLPHSCDEWIIASGSKEQVLAEIAVFRAELDKAEATIRDYTPTEGTS